MGLANDCSDTALREIADLIHDKNCHWNHTDGCGYFYDSWNDPGSSELDRRRAYNQAQIAFRLSKLKYPEELLKMIKSIDFWMVLDRK